MPSYWIDLSTEKKIAGWFFFCIFCCCCGIRRKGNIIWKHWIILCDIVRLSQKVLSAKCTQQQQQQKVFRYLWTSKFIDSDAWQMNDTKIYGNCADLCRLPQDYSQFFFFHSLKTADCIEIAPPVDSSFIRSDLFAMSSSLQSHLNIHTHIHVTNQIIKEREKKGYTLHCACGCGVNVYAIFRLKCGMLRVPVCVGRLSIASYGNDGRYIYDSFNKMSKWKVPETRIRHP